MTGLEADEASGLGFRACGVLFGIWVRWYVEECFAVAGFPGVLGFRGIPKIYNAILESEYFHRKDPLICRRVVREMTERQSDIRTIQPDLRL